MQAKSIKGNSPEEIKHSQDKSFNANDLDTTLHKINVVPQDIGRVVLNLINNAFHACAERASAGSVETTSASSDHTSPADSPGIPYEPTVSISTKKQGDRVEIRVKDNGNGISDHIKEKIFQPFFTTIPIAIGTTGQGTGFGLSLSHDIVKAHGRELKVETKEDEGSTFIIQLPLY
jgi:signal transduction histidine kinase